MALPTLSADQIEDIYVTTFNKKLPDVVDNVYLSNPLIAILNAQERILLDGGRPWHHGIYFLGWQHIAAASHTQAALEAFQEIKAVEACERQRPSPERGMAQHKFAKGAEGRGRFDREEGIPEKSPGKFPVAQKQLGSDSGIADFIINSALGPDD